MTRKISHYFCYDSHKFTIKICFLEMKLCVWRWNNIFVNFVFSCATWSCQLSRATCDFRIRSRRTWRSNFCPRSRLHPGPSRTTRLWLSRASRRIWTRTSRTDRRSRSSLNSDRTSWSRPAEWPTLHPEIGKLSFPIFVNMFHRDQMLQLFLIEKETMGILFLKLCRPIHGWL